LTKHVGVLTIDSKRLHQSISIGMMILKGWWKLGEVWNRRRIKRRQKLQENHFLSR
jgi:hypothetical protein